MGFVEQFLLVAVAHLMGVASPGPDFAIVVKNSVNSGRKSAIYTSLGISTGILIHVSYCIAGVGIIINSSEILFNILKTAGALYLGYIGVKSLTLATKCNEVYFAQENKLKNKMEAYKNGLFVNLLNPKATLFFLAVFTTILRKDSVIEYKIIFGIYMAVATMCWFSMISFLFGIKRVRDLFIRYNNSFEKIMGVIFITFGILTFFAKK